MSDEEDDMYRRATIPAPEPKPVFKQKPSPWSTMSQERKDRINEALKRAGLDEVMK